ncbi:LytTR family DNA-binding domain-containing protein [Pseudoflavonifractor sp. An85]|uniref:LytR/AlgR family response regulator transcription factor n=1 Tax=Pseudoflavonifractor sp. An85 TaxID=1965661 RepID=UPI000B36A16A|nr:LytTR family DNA-binding domain-containing protein [Pseudoflavonifractor sp. An85]OUN24617.1 hypothetical protein B5G37_06510 [Pseudoflavonifractor sp. An85]
MWNVVVCDDEAAVHRQLQSYLDQFAQESGYSFHLAHCHSAEQLLSMVSPHTDLLFLDISMGAMSGMEAAHILRQTYPELCLVFLTSMVQYALEGYQVHAFGFLAKPLTYAQFRLQMADVVRALSAKQSQTISLKIGTEVHNLSPSSILYAEVCNHNVDIHLLDSTLRCYGTITEVEQLLAPHGFSRPHQSYLVNLRRISTITQTDVHMDNGSVLPLSKRKRKEFLQDFTTYLGSALP